MMADFPTVVPWDRRGQPGGAAPTVVLVGDSIRLGYAALVAERLRGVAEILSARENGGDSANVLAHLDEWVIDKRPALVHLNTGLHDLKRSRAGGAYQVPLERYAQNLREVVRRVQSAGVPLVFALTTPIHDADPRCAPRRAWRRLRAQRRGRAALQRGRARGHARGRRAGT
jgi:hypothetical protein